MRIETLKALESAVEEATYGQLPVGFETLAATALSKTAAAWIEKVRAADEAIAGNIARARNGETRPQAIVADAGRTRTLALSFISCEIMKQVDFMKQSAVVAKIATLADSKPFLRACLAAKKEAKKRGYCRGSWHQSLPENYRVRFLAEMSGGFLGFASPDQIAGRSCDSCMLRMIESGCPDR